MPYINIRLGTTVTSRQQQQLQVQTTSLMHTIMGKRQEVTVVHIQESTADQWSTNSMTLNQEDPVSAYVEIKVTQGTNTADEKSAMIAATVNMLKEVMGTIQEACYVVIDEIPANSWGYDGKTQAERTAAKR